MTMANLADLSVDESELDVPAEPAAEGERRYATASDAERVAHLAALLGVSFPSGLVADMGGYVRDSVDDLFDGLPESWELQFSRPSARGFTSSNKCLAPRAGVSASLR